MTAKEKLKLEHPAMVSPVYNGGAFGCPLKYGYLEKPDYCDDPNKECDPKLCAKCWDREIPDTADDCVENSEVVSKKASEGPHILDSGNRRKFESGAVRDIQEGKGDMVSIPWESILRLSVHYEGGAKKYERWNFRKGIPVSSFIDSACRHLAKYQCGCDDEDHLAAAAFNILGAMLMENTRPEMQDLPLREGKNTFDYFKKSL